MIVICKDCGVQKETEDNIIAYCKCGKRMMTPEELAKLEPKPIEMCKQCKKFIAKFNGLCGRCDMINTLVGANLPVPSFKSVRKKRWIEGNFECIESESGHITTKHRLSKKNKDCGSLDKMCSKLNTNDLEALRKLKNKDITEKWKELDSQFKITKSEYDQKLKLLDTMLQKKSISKTIYDEKLKKLDYQLDHGTLTKQQIIDKRREINCQMEIISDWIKLKKKQSGIL